MRATFKIFIASILLCSCSSTDESADINVSSDSIKDTAPKKLISLSTPFYPEIEDQYKSLKLELEEIFNSDQGIRNKFIDLEKKYGRNSKEVKALTNEWQIIDSINCLKVTAILDKHGWLNPNEIGGQGNTTLFLVIQHSDIKIQEKYLPMMRKAVKDGNAQASELALLEDRILLRHGKKQIYGSQIETDKKTGKYIVGQIEDEVNVNKRRAAVGLQPLEEYVKQWDIKYKVPVK